MGIEVESAQLAAIAKQLQAGADSLNGVVQALPDAVDAGFSSDVANAALARVGKAALALGRQGDAMASNIDVAKGAYESTDEDAANEVETAEEHLEDRKAQQGPLKDAPPKPTPAEPGSRPAPPPAPSN